MEEEKFMGPFFASVSSVNDKMADIEDKMATLEKEARDQQNLFLEPEKQAFRDRYAELIAKSNQESGQIKSELKKMEKDNVKFAKSNPNELAEIRIRENMQSTLTSKFMQLMKNYTLMQNRHREVLKEQCKRHLKATMPEASDERVEQAFVNNEQVFMQAVQNTGRKEVNAQLHIISAQHEVILQLESSIAELHQLFQDMAILVETQGDLINHIERSVDKAKAYTEKGVSELRQAGRYQRKDRKSHTSELQSHSFISYAVFCLKKKKTH
eukprot:TRINITY_DN4707_c0_g1_i1.p1 TRINITY_DN4707_c0_g1~~TRINITY_DN4707_c0_g1_i1.p1  ORF type:complete len:305 (+),score=67.98 TRINITY_DN4707_c0_g1_i1:111-917(+)